MYNDTTIKQQQTLPSLTTYLVCHCSVLAVKHHRKIIHRITSSLSSPMLGMLTPPKTATKLAIVGFSLYSLLQWWIKRTRYGGLQGKGWFWVG